MPLKNSIFVFDLVRSNSQAFNKLFAAHPQLEQIFMPMIAAALHGPDAVWRGRGHSELTEQTFRDLAKASGVAETETNEAAVDRIELAVAAASEKGKVPWLKDHAMCVIPPAVQDVWIAGTTMPQAFRSNPTVFSTDFLDSLTPIFLIRHPALSIPSFYRKNITVCKNKADDEDFAVYVALYWSRLIFDSFVLRSGSEGKVPIVVDAADVIYNTEPVIRALCARLGIDFAGVQFSWTPLPENEWPESPVLRAFFADLYRSNGLERRADKPAEVTMDLDAVQEAWREEFGPEDAKTLRVLVDRELEHYEYLQQVKLQV